MFTIYRHFGDFFKCIFTILFKFSMKITFYLPLNNDKQTFVTFLEFFCRLHNLLLKFRLSKMSRNETPSWLRSQNSEYPMIFRVTRANQNARKLLFTDSVNTKIVYFVFFLPTLKPYLYSLSYSGSGSCYYSLSCSEFRMSVSWFSRHPL